VNFSNLSQLTLIFKQIEVTKFKIILFLILYYLVTGISAFLDVFGILMLVSIFTENINYLYEQTSSIPIIKSIFGIVDFNTEIQDLFLILILIFSLSFILKFSLLGFNSWLKAKIRKKLQERIFKIYLNSNWNTMRDFPVGTALGTNTNEANLSVTYISNLITFGYFLISSIIFSIISLYLDFKTFTFLAILSLPFLVILKYIMNYQVKLSIDSADQRNLFSAHITDRLNGLFQILADKNLDYHFKKGIRSQHKLTSLEIKIGLCAAFIGTFIILIPLSCLIVFYIWFYNDLTSINITSTATIILLGIKLMNQFNGLIGSYGNLVRLAGSLYPVSKVLKFTLDDKRKNIATNIDNIKIKNLSFKYNDNFILNNINFKVEKGCILIIKGESGKGKSTLANIISGIYLPQSGSIIYQDLKSKEKFDSKTHKINVGYVTQDIYFFEGSFRENLSLGQNLIDDKIWNCLKSVDAEKFIIELGGLNMKTTEAGKSLSGGQKRRLGIARAILSQSDVLIFDEITNGLDKKNKVQLEKLVNSLCKSHIIIYITHEDTNFYKQKILQL